MVPAHLYLWHSRKVKFEYQILWKYLCMSSSPPNYNGSQHQPYRNEFFFLSEKKTISSLATYSKYVYFSFWWATHSYNHSICSGIVSDILLYLQKWHSSQWFNDWPGIDSMYNQAMDAHDSILCTISMYLQTQYVQHYIHTKPHVLSSSLCLTVCTN